MLLMVRLAPFQKMSGTSKTDPKAVPRTLEQITFGPPGNGALASGRLLLHYSGLPMSW